MDHIIPQAAGGRTVFANLALACVFCSLRKGARLTARDPRTGKTVPIYHPRKERWNLHFRWAGIELRGISEIGRATVGALGLNSREHRIIRSFERELDRHPPPGHV